MYSRGVRHGPFSEQQDKSNSPIASDLNHGVQIARIPLNLLRLLVWPPLQSLAVKKKTFELVQSLGGEKLLKFGEKWAVKYF